MKLNVGHGGWPLAGYVNVDNRVLTFSQTMADARALPFRDESFDEIYAGHLVEHLERDEARTFLAECRRCLKPGGKLGIVVPDMRAVFERYVTGQRSAVEFLVKSTAIPRQADMTNLDDVAEWFIYSTGQDSPHRWCYDEKTLRRLLEENGFVVTGTINRWFDARIPVGAFYQCGWDAVKEA